jgi:hypothetical protein
MNEKIVSDKYVSIEKLKYRKDKLAYALAILGLLVNVFYFIALYQNNANFYYAWKIGVSILYNLVFMLFVFLSAEGVKYYHRKYSILLLVIGVLQVIRIFIYPRQCFAAEVLTQTAYTKLCIYLLVSGTLLISSGICSLTKSTILNNFLKSQKL